MGYLLRVWTKRQGVTGWRWAAVLVACVAAGAAQAVAASMPVAGDGGHLWIMRATEVAPAGQGTESPGPAVTVLHRSASDPVGELVEVETLRGELRPGGAAASGHALWLAYQDGTVQRLDVSPSPIEPGRRFASRIEAPLPGPGELRAMTAGPSGAGTSATVWALMRLPAQVTPLSRSRAGEDAGASGDGVGAAAKRSPDLRDVLLRLRGGRWEAVALPDDWPQGAQAWLAPGGTDDGRPTVLVQAAGGDNGVVVYRGREGQWQRTDYEDVPSLAGAQVAAVQGQLVVCRPMPSSDSLRVAVSVLRDGDRWGVGEFVIDAPLGSEWGVAPMGLTVALVARSPKEADDAATADPGPGLTWARMDLHGTVTQPPTALTLRPENAWRGAADYVMMVAIGLLSVLMLLVFWRRDPAKQQLDLPDQWVLADLMRRAMAGLIDLAPGVIIVLRVYELGLLDLLEHHWPGNTPDLQASLPGLVVIGIYVGHTTVSELIATRTLGKALLGLRVVDLQGGRPRAWQLLARGVLKGFDLVAWLLLILPMLGAYRQRLGDLLGRTVVVAARGQADEDGEEKEPDDD